MSGERTMWTRDPHTGEAHLAIAGAVPMRLAIWKNTASEQIIGWSWDAWTRVPGEASATLRRAPQWGDAYPTREAAQAAAEAWVRDFARGLLAAVGEEEA